MRDGRRRRCRVVPVWRRSRTQRQAVAARSSALTTSRCCGDTLEATADGGRMRSVARPAPAPRRGQPRRRRTRRCARRCVPVVSGQLLREASPRGDLPGVQRRRCSCRRWRHDRWSVGDQGGAQPARDAAPANAGRDDDGDLPAAVAVGVQVRDADELPGTVPCPTARSPSWRGNSHCTALRASTVPARNSRSRGEHASRRSSAPAASRLDPVSRHPTATPSSTAGRPSHSCSYSVRTRRSGATMSLVIMRWSVDYDECLSQEMWNGVRD